MKLVIQRVSQASVTIDGSIYSSIGAGVLVLVGIGQEDDEADIKYLVGKMINMRIFSDTAGKMNLSVMDISGEIMVISQFTLFADTRKGNRPSYITAANPEKAIPLYESFISATEAAIGKTVKTGIFGADMKVQLVNDGPVTIMIDSKNKS